MQRFYSISTNIVYSYISRQKALCGRKTISYFNPFIRIGVNILLNILDKYFLLLLYFCYWMSYCIPVDRFIQNNFFPHRCSTTINYIKMISLAYFICLWLFCSIVWSIFSPVRSTFWISNWIQTRNCVVKPNIHNIITKFPLYFNRELFLGFALKSIIFQKNSIPFGYIGFYLVLPTSLNIGELFFCCVPYRDECIQIGTLLNW